MDRLKDEVEHKLLDSGKREQEPIRVSSFFLGAALILTDLTLRQLPFDVIELIARRLVEECLTDDDYGVPRTTLARLNRVSKSYHEATLAALYETTDYFDEGILSSQSVLRIPEAGHGPSTYFACFRCTWISILRYTKSDICG